MGCHSGAAEVAAGGDGMRKIYGFRRLLRALEARRGGRGFALVTVLGVLGLALVLVVGLLQSSMAEHRGALVEGEAQRMRELETAAVNLVVGQLRKVSSVEGEAWVSQPGAVRKYGAGGEFSAGHRLYSAEAMDVGEEGELAGDRAPEGWEDEPWQWCDLNAPVMRDGGAAFPIVDPRAMTAGAGYGGVEGFSVDWEEGEEGPRVPMPVRWLYFLESGDFGVLDGEGNYAGTGEVSKGNPIVGRAAFWTDDESCKLNVNTAAEPTFWDTPRVMSKHATSQGENLSQVLHDRAYASFQPAQREYQRYPGHPAMTSLGPVLFPDMALAPESKEIIYGMTPRLVGGGSKGGTVTVAETEGLVTDGERLYATLDEYLLRPDRSAQALLDAEAVGRSRFFLTAASRAPETTLFGTPRVALWPTHHLETDGEGRALRTAYDNLIRFCASDGGGVRRYGFERMDCESPTADWEGIPRNRELLRYLRRLTDRAVPGYGGRLVDKLGEGDRDQLLVEILDYIRSTNLHDDNLEPTRYTARGQEHVQFTPGRMQNSTTYGWKGHGEVTPLRVPEGLGESYPAQPDTTSHMGFGRFFTISEAGMLFIACADPDVPESNVATPDPDGGYPERNHTLEPGVPLEPGERRIQMMLFFEWFCPSHGWTQIRPDFSVEVEQVGGRFAVDGVDLEIPTNVMVDSGDPAFQCWGLHPWGAGASYRGFLKNRGVPQRGVMTADTRPGDWWGDSNRYEYGLVSAPITIDASDETMRFTGPETVRVKVYAGTSYTHARELVQTIEMHFPEADFPLPRLVRVSSHHVPSDGQSRETVPQNWWTLHRDGVRLNLGANSFGRLLYVWGRPHDSQGTIIRPDDTFKSLVPYHGDYRLVAGSHYVPKGVFQPSSFYFDPSRANAVRSHITGSSGSSQDWVANWQPGAADRLVEGANYESYRFPDFPMFADAETRQRRSARPFQMMGDFDNGIATTYDGAYINKPDEGNTYLITSGGIPYYSSNWNQVPAGESYFSPNRQMPGPGMLGSLPVRLRSGNVAFDPSAPEANLDPPWRTLLFRPQEGHAGAADPPDHLWMDLFWMPVVEPFALSEPFSTAGKVNMNYQMIPFPHVRRATAMHGVLRSEEMLLLKNNHGSVYKGSTNPPEFRYGIDAEETLRQFDERFGRGEVFRSATEICDLYLVPAGHPDNPKVETMGTFWAGHRLTGDNSRERPYTNLHPRLTVRSNTFRVHYTVQAIGKARSTPDGAFDPERDVVLGEKRGHYLLERYIEPGDADLPDYATDAGAESLERFYRYRVGSRADFRP